MRVSRVEIRNLLGFRDVDIDIDPQFQLVAGPNNAGKSSLIRVLEAFFTGNVTAFTEMRPLNSYYTTAGPRILSEVRVWFSDLTRAEAEHCQPAMLASREFWLAVRTSRAGAVSYRASKKVSADVSENLYGYVLSRFQFAKIPSVRVGGVGDLEQPHSLERLMDTLEAVLIRSGSARSTALQQRFATQAREVENIVGEVLEYAAVSLESELPFDTGTIRFRLNDFRFALRALLEAIDIESDDGATVSVRERGTGFQSALILGVLHYVAQQEGNAANVFFAIEEPEAFLHPQTQRAMVRVLREINEDAQVLATTHSPILVDSFDINQTLRLPLNPEGLSFIWREPQLSDADVGRLTRWSNAANSELVFSTAVVIVEGESDLQLVKWLLDDLCGGANEHHARGVTVLAAGGLGNAKNLVEVANHFEVPSFVVADKDGLASADNGRRLLDVLSARRRPISRTRRETWIATADAACPTYNEALRIQRRLNVDLARYGAFVYSSDLEGMLVDSFGVDFALDVLGPEGEAFLSAEYLDQLEEAADRRAKLARRLGSKGWRQTGKPSHKLLPHLPRILIQEYGAALDEGEDWPIEVRRLRAFLETALAATPETVPI